MVLSDLRIIEMQTSKCEHKKIKELVVRRPKSKPHDWKLTGIESKLNLALRYLRLDSCKNHSTRSRATNFLHLDEFRKSN